MNEEMMMEAAQIAANVLVVFYATIYEATKDAHIAEHATAIYAERFIADYMDGIRNLVMERHQDDET